LIESFTVTDAESFQPRPQFFQTRHNAVRAEDQMRAARVLAGQPDELPELRVDRRLSAFELKLEHRAPGAARKSDTFSQVPRGDEQVLHHGQERLQWLVRAT
jgi:hypothetical protein